MTTVKKKISNDLIKNLFCAIFTNTNYLKKKSVSLRKVKLNSRSNSTLERIKEKYSKESQIEHAFNFEKKSKLKELAAPILNPTKPGNLFIPRVIVVTSGKGGVGKTTCTANIGLGLALAGFRVLMVDCDLGLKNLDIVLGVERKVPFSALDFFQGRCKFSQVLVKSNQTKNASFLALTKTKQQCHFSLDHMSRAMRLVNFLEYHYILVDCPAGIDAGFLNAITPATESIIVTTPDITAIRDADRIAGILDNSHITNIKLLINRLDSKLIESNTIMDIMEVQEILGLNLLGAIPSDSQITASTNKGKPLIIEGNKTLSGTAFGKVIDKLINEKFYKFPYNVTQNYKFN